MFKLSWVLIVVCLLASGCASVQPAARIQPLGHKVDLNNAGIVKNNLYRQYKSWAGVPHKDGGMTKKGVDCSAFVYLTMREQLGVEIPRTSKLQAEVGTRVRKKSALRPGDLVLFRTQFVSRHVGIYMGDGKFLHVSSKKGVKVSGLEDYYWADRFSQGRRLQ